MTPNPIQAWLDDAGLPWRIARAELPFGAGLAGATRAGRDRLDVELAREPLRGLIAPFAIRLSPLLAPYLPATLFTARASFGLDARENLRRTAEQLAAALGPAPVETRSNTLQVVWTAGRASVRLLVWPADTQPAGHSRPADPRREASCHVTLQSGFCPRLSADERRGLTTFWRLGGFDVARDGLGPPETDGPAENVLELVRDAEGTPDIDGTVGVSADRRYLISRPGTSTSCRPGRSSVSTSSACCRPGGAVDRSCGSAIVPTTPASRRRPSQSGPPQGRTT